jgi:hypothetical protein
VLDAAERRALLPESALPLAYFAFAHLGFLTALLVLAVRPDVPGAFFYHPRMVALVHLVTLVWLTGSILGAFYVVAPLALRLPLPAGRIDWGAFAAFCAGAGGMVAGLWTGDYDAMAVTALLALAAIAWVGARAWRRLPAAPVPWPVKLHVALAFTNIVAAAGFGIFIALNRRAGWAGGSPLAAAYAHAHLAAVGWVAMMVVGLAYRLIPMIVPAAMPTGSVLATSAILIEAGLAVLVWSLLASSGWLPLGAALIAAGFASFVAQIRRTLRRRLPRPPALPPRDWSTWQTHVALAWLLASLVLGLALSVGVPGRWHATAAWTYGVAGLVGFLAQIVTGMQGRLVPLYAWYRAFARFGAPPRRAANALPSSAFARPIFLCWTAGVPLLAAGLASGWLPLISAGALVLAGGVATGGIYIRYMLRAALEDAEPRGGAEGPA